MSKSSVLFITNGDSKTGFGHISQSLIVANEFSVRNHNVIFLALESSPFIDWIAKSFQNVFLTSSFHKLNSREIIQDLVKKFQIEIVVINLVEEEYDKLNWIRKDYPGLFIVTITLFLFSFEKRYEHLSFFPDLSAPKELIADGKYGKFKLYSGRNYFVFRDEFKNIERQQNKVANKILISMGGSDPCNFTSLVLRSLNLSDVFISVIISNVAPGYQEVKNFIHNQSTKNIRLIEKTNHIAKEMCQHDILILNGGSTRYEACLTFTPFIAIAIHQKQFNITKQLTDLGIGINLGIGKFITPNEIDNAVSSLLNDYSKRKNMAYRMKELFNTSGAERIYNSIILDKQKTI